MALGLAWATALLVVFASILVLDKMGFFRSKNKFPVEGRVSLFFTNHTGALILIQ